MSDAYDDSRPPSRADFVRLQGALDRLREEMAPLLAALQERSGDKERMDRLRRDVDSVHDKCRTLDARLDSVDRWLWAIGGVLGFLQFLQSALKDGLRGLFQ